MNIEVISYSVSCHSEGNGFLTAGNKLARIFDELGNRIRLTVIAKILFLQL